MSSEQTQTAEHLAAENKLATTLILIVLVALVLWGASIWMWGVVGLYMPAVALVPVCYVVLLLISRG